MCSRPLEERFRDTCIRLYEWGEWSTDTHNHGYPRMSHEQSAREGAGINTRGSGFKVIPQSSEISQVDSILLELKNNDPMQFKIVEHYFSGQHATLRYVWKKLGGHDSRYSRAKVREELMLAVAWVDGQI